MYRLEGSIASRPKSIVKSRDGARTFADGQASRRIDPPSRLKKV
jgi:hypothetical protein